MPEMNDNELDATKREMADALEAASKPKPIKHNMQPDKTPMPEQDPTERAANFKEVSLGYDEKAAINEAMRCLHCAKEPCMNGCPVNVPISQFIAQIRTGNFARAYAIVKSKNMLPAICGRVCPQERQCEGHCTRGKRGEPVGIGHLERFVADWAIEHPREALAALVEEEAADETMEDRSQFRYKKVACIGSGPASLTCAGALAQQGIDVTVYEALHRVGGVLSYGIPEFRLPKTLIATEVKTIMDMGVKFELNAVVGKIYTIDEMLNDMRYDAVFVGTGAGAPVYMNVPGEALNGVMVANELLTRVNLMKAYRFPEYQTPVYVGKKCIVVGGGNVAMDAARTAKRLGADVTIVYRRGREEMPARDEEIMHAEQEGIKFEYLTGPTQIKGDENGWAKSMECARMKLGAPDESGRRRPEEIPGQRFEAECDMVVIAVGSRTNALIANTTRGLESTKRNLIVVDEETCATSVPGVFAGGDATSGAATVILAMGAGKRAAQGIIGYLKEKGAPEPIKVP